MHTRNTPEPLYRLPDDLATVKCIAFIQGITNAYLARRNVRITHPDDGPSIDLMGAVSIRNHLARTQDGRTGTNNETLFHETFLRTYRMAHKAANRLLRETDAASILDRIGDGRMGLFLLSYAQDHPDLVEAAYRGQDITLPVLK